MTASAIQHQVGMVLGAGSLEDVSTLHEKMRSLLQRLPLLIIATLPTYGPVGQFPTTS